MHKPLAFRAGNRLSIYPDAAPGIRRKSYAKPYPKATAKHVP